MKALLLGYYGARNLGDDMMLFCLSHWLKQQHVETIVISEDPGDTITRFGLPAIQNAPLLFQWGAKHYWGKGYAARLIYAVRRADALIVGGGDLIRDDRGWRTFRYTMEKVVIALLLRKPVYLVNVGIHRAKRAYSRKILRAALRRVKMVIARDRSTYEYALECGTRRAVLLPDIALLLPWYLGIDPRATQKQPIYRVSLRHRPNTFGSYVMEDDQVATLAYALDKVVEEHRVRVVFTPFQDADERDNVMHCAVRDRMKYREEAEIEEWCGDLQSLTERFMLSRAVLAMRLHAGVLGIATSTPCVLMPYDRKVRELAEVAGINLLLEPHELSCPDCVANKLREGLHVSAQYGDILRRAEGWRELSLDG